MLLSAYLRVIFLFQDHFWVWISFGVSRGTLEEQIDSRSMQEVVLLLYHCAGSACGQQEYFFKYLKQLWESYSWLCPLTDKDNQFWTIFRICSNYWVKWRKADIRREPTRAPFETYLLTYLYNFFGMFVFSWYFSETIFLYKQIFFPPTK